MSEERTPLLQSEQESGGPSVHQFGDHHGQFCHLVGTRPITLPQGEQYKPHPESLYHRTVSRHASQNRTYMFTAALTNSLILAQVVLGATLTGLGASNSNHIVITVFGAANTIIAGLIAFLKSRGQPMRARMFRDDLARIVDEIENSAVMWLGISKKAHGYDAIDTEDQVTVRSEVARLTRLYDKAVKTSTLNDPDTYSTGAPGDPHIAALKGKGGPLPASAPAPTPAAGPSGPGAPAPVAAVSSEDPDDSPATKAPDPPTAKEIEESTKDKTKASADEPDAKNKSDTDSAKKTPDAKASPSDPTQDSEASQIHPGVQAGSSANAVPTDPGESPALAIPEEKHTQDTSNVTEDKK